ncbi:hypothetical protein AHAS_Ahas11G0247300 [Arachis hypogaea]
MARLAEVERQAQACYSNQPTQPSLEALFESLGEKTKIMREEGEKMDSSMEDFILWSRKFREEQDITFKNIEVHIDQLTKYLAKPTNTFPSDIKKESKAMDGVVLSKEDEDQMVGTREELEKQEKEVPIPSEIPMKKEEVVRVYKTKAPYLQRLLRMTKKHANSLPKEAIQNLAEEREEVNQGSPHSNETESCIKGEFIEPPIQEALDEKDASTSTQQPSLEIKEVKAINKSTKKRIVTKIRRTTFMRNKRSTANNPTPAPTSKANQANNKRKLVGRHPKQGTSTYSSLPLRSFS